MNKTEQPFTGNHNQDFIYQVLSEKELGEKHPIDFMDHDDSIASFTLENDKFQTSFYGQPNSNKSSNSNKHHLQSLEDEVNKKTLELTCYRSKLCETICQYEAKIQKISNIILKNVQFVNSILAYLKLDNTCHLEFMVEQEIDEIKSQTYLQTNFRKIMKELSKYSKDAKTDTNVDQIHKLKEKNKILSYSLLQKNQNIDKLKKKISQVRCQRNLVKVELQKYKSTVEEAQKMELKLELKLFTRHQLITCMRNLIKRISMHEKICFKLNQFFNAEKILALANQKEEEQIEAPEDSNSTSVSPKKSRPPLSPRKAKRT